LSKFLFNRWWRRRRRKL